MYTFARSIPVWRTPLGNAQQTSSQETHHPSCATHGGRVKRCFASLFADRAISYRTDTGFDHVSIALSIGVQRMVRPDLATSGVMFSLDTETPRSRGVDTGTEFRHNVPNIKDKWETYLLAAIPSMMRSASRLRLPRGRMCSHERLFVLVVTFASFLGRDHREKSSHFASTLERGLYSTTMFWLPTVSYTTRCFASTQYGYALSIPSRVTATTRSMGGRPGSRRPLNKKRAINAIVSEVRIAAVLAGKTRVF